LDTPSGILNGLTFRQAFHDDKSLIYQGLNAIHPGLPWYAVCSGMPGNCTLEAFFVGLLPADFLC
jgi:hypothetical protein